MAPRKITQKQADIIATIIDMAVSSLPIYKGGIGKIGRHSSDQSIKIAVDTLCKLGHLEKIDTPGGHRQAVAFYRFTEGGEAACRVLISPYYPNYLEVKE